MPNFSDSFRFILNFTLALKLGFINVLLGSFSGSLAIPQEAWMADALLIGHARNDSVFSKKKP